MELDNYQVNDRECQLGLYTYFKSFHQCRKKQTIIKSKQISLFIKKSESKIPILKSFKFRHQIYQERFQTKVLKEILSLIIVKKKLLAEVSNLLGSSCSIEDHIKNIKITEKKIEDYYKLYRKTVLSYQEAMKITILLVYKNKISENNPHASSSLLNLNPTYSTSKRLSHIKELSISHFMGLCNVAISHKDNIRIVMGLSDSTIRIVKINSGKVIKVLLGHSLIITSLFFYDNFKYLISTSRDSKIIMWNFGKGKIKKRISQDNLSIETADLLENTFIVGINTGFIILWKLPEWIIMTKIFIERKITRIRLRDHEIFIVKYDYTHLIFNIFQRKIVHQFKVESTRCEIQMSSSRRFIIITANNFCIIVQLYSPYNKRSILNGEVYKEKLLLTLDDNMILYFKNLLMYSYNIQTRTEVEIRNIGIAPRLLINSNNNDHAFIIYNSVYIYDINLRHQAVKKYELRDINLFIQIEFDLLNNVVYGIINQYHLVKYDLINQTSEILSKGYLNQFALSIDKKTLIALSLSHAYIFDTLNTKKNSIILECNEIEPLACFSDCNKYFALAETGLIKIYNKDNYEEFYKLRFNRVHKYENVTQLKFSDDSTKLISVYRAFRDSYNNCIRIFCLRNRTLLREINCKRDDYLWFMIVMKEKEEIILLSNSNFIFKANLSKDEFYPITLNIYEHIKEFKKINYLPYRPLILR